VTRLTSTVALVAVAVWLGGLMALGAIAAPIVFGTVPAPASADAMTLVFRRFDTVAMTCAAVVLAAEAVRAATRQPLRGLDVARVSTAVVAAALALTEGLWLSPRIEALHRAGAVRGLGAPGLELESAHRLAEHVGKGEVALGLVLIALHVATVARGPQRRAPGA